MNYRGVGGGGGVKSIFEAFGSTQIQSTLGEKKSQKVYNKPRSKREFQFKIFNCIIFTNDKLFLFGVADSPTCPLCQTEVESIEHLLSTFPVKYHPIFGSVSCP